jgi:hypothetical protein
MVLGFVCKYLNLLGRSGVRRLLFGSASPDATVVAPVTP